MIAGLLPTRLLWEAGRGGVTRLCGVEVRLEAAPDLGSVPVVAIDYAPGAFATVQPFAEAERDMETHERAAADALLRELTKGARDASA